MPGNTGNYANYKSEKMKELFTKLRSTTDAAAYQQVLYDIQQLFSQDIPFICMFYRGGSILTKEMYSVVRDVRELELLRGIDSFQQE